MHVKIHMDCSNAAFDDAPASEVARILRDLATRIEQEGPAYVVLRDANGNRVGEYQAGGER